MSNTQNKYTFSLEDSKNKTTRVVIKFKAEGEARIDVANFVQDHFWQLGQASDLVMPNEAVHSFLDRKGVSLDTFIAVLSALARDDGESVAEFLGSSGILDLSHVSKLDVEIEEAK